MLDADGDEEGFWDKVEKSSGSSSYFQLHCIMRPSGPTDHQNWGKLGKLNRYTCRIRTRITLLVYQR